MINNIFKCPVCHEGMLIPFDLGHIVCNNNIIYEEPHFSWRAGADGHESFIFGVYQIFFYELGIEVYDLSKNRYECIIHDTNSSISFEDINSASKLELFVKNYLILS